MRKFFCAFIIMMALCSCSHAAITKTTVQKAWNKIAKADGFKVIAITYEKSTSPNAWVKFKSSNNFSVHVTQGLMNILSNEDEIAGVLGHEIGHVRLNHYSKGVNRAVGTAVGKKVASSVLGKFFGGIGQIVGNIGVSVAADLAESGFSREQEIEADDYGTTLLVKAGYPSDGLYRAMKSFADHNIITQPSGFNSHPPTERRLKHLKEKAASLKPKTETKSE